MACVLCISPAASGEEPEIVPIGSIRPDTLGDTLTITGRIVNVIPPNSENSPCSLYITDEEDTVRAVIWKQTWENIPVNHALKPGVLVYVRGKIKEFSNNLSLYVEKPGDITIKGSGRYPGETTPQISSTRETVDLSGVLSPGQISFPLIGEKVTVKGEVTKYVSSWSESAPSSIFLQGDSGEIRIVYWNDVSSEMDFTPRPGGILKVYGKVSEYQGDLQIKVYEADHITIEGGKAASSESGEANAGTFSNPRSLEVSEISEKFLGQYLIVSGKIAEINPSWMQSAPTTLTITDGEGQIDVVYWSDVADNIPDELQPRKGEEFIFRGTLDEYRNDLQLKIQSVDAISKPGYDPEKSESSEKSHEKKEPGRGKASSVPISEVSLELKGEIVTVTGTVEDVKPSWMDSAPTIVTLADNGNTVDVVYWKDVAENIPSSKKPEKGMKITVKAEVDEYRNNLQLRLETAEDISVENGESPSRESSQKSSGDAVGIDSLTEDMVGKPALIHGEVTDVINIKGGRLLKVKDSTGTITVPLWDDMAEKSDNADLISEGSILKIKGEVYLYEPRDEIQIKLVSPEGIVSVEN